MPVYAILRYFTPLYFPLRLFAPLYVTLCYFTVFRHIVHKFIFFHQYEFASGRLLEAGTFPKIVIKQAIFKSKLGDGHLLEHGRLLEFLRHVHPPLWLGRHTCNKVLKLTFRVVKFNIVYTIFITITIYLNDKK